MLAAFVNTDLNAAHPIPGSAFVESQQFGKSLWGKTGKLTVKLPDATLEDYFLKVILCPARGPFF